MAGGSQVGRRRRPWSAAASSRGVGLGALLLLHSVDIRLFSKIAAKRRWLKRKELIHFSKEREWIVKLKKQEKE